MAVGVSAARGHAFPHLLTDRNGKERKMLTILILCVLFLAGLILSGALVLIVTTREAAMMWSIMALTMLFGLLASIAYL